MLTGGTGNDTLVGGYGTDWASYASATGAVNGDRITAVDDDGNHGDAAGLSRLTYDPQNGINQMSLTASSADAVATVNGIEVKSSTNTFNGVVQGLNIVAKKVTTSGVGLTVTRNTGAVQNAVKAFVTTYNDLVDLIKEQTKYDPERKEAALFQGAEIASVICGPGHIEQAHQPNEWVSLEQLARCEAFMRRLADHVCVA